MTATYPRTIDNGAGGEQMTWLGVRRDGGAEYLDARCLAQPGAVAPMHIHKAQTEQMTVESGRLGYRRSDGVERFADPGQSVKFPPGEPHCWWNAGDGELTMAGFVTPPLNFEYFLGEIYASTKRSGGRRPNPLDAAYLVKRFGAEFAILDIPAPVQRFVFPALRALGAASGRYHRFADAPAPIPPGGR
jgi:quercetin dioxygenase-like cupin family protein